MRKKYVVSSEKLVKKLTGRKRLNYENELNKIAVFSNELENVHNLNFKICNFSQENLELE
jgi:hypothetical protein